MLRPQMSRAQTTYIVCQNDRWSTTGWIARACFVAVMVYLGFTWSEDAIMVWMRMGGATLQPSCCFFSVSDYTEIDDDDEQQVATLGC